MDKQKIIKKFGNDFIVNEKTFLMGIDVRFTEHFSKRFKNLCVLETCSGGGFTSISMAKYAKKVYSFEIDKQRIIEAKQNSQIAGVKEKITFINDTILNITKYKFISEIESAFLDPDWAVTGPNHKYKFINSNTLPPSDLLFKTIYKITNNIALIQPPYIDTKEFDSLTEHETEYLYMNNSLELFCLYFGLLKKNNGITEYRI